MKQQENIRYVFIWSGILRFCHWLLAAGVLFQIVSSWAITIDQRNNDFWLDWHMITGQIIVLTLGVRIILLFIPVCSNSSITDSWRAFVPEKAQFSAMLQMIKFYLSLARFPLPNWYAHNPLWSPIYPLFFLVLIVCCISGLQYHSSYEIFQQPISWFHEGSSDLIVIFTIFHIITAFLHDLKGKGAYTSAMINGYRYFHYKNQENTENSKSSNKQSVSITVDSIEKQKPNSE